MKAMHELLSLKHATVLITGAAMGIGYAIAERYAEAGAKLQLVDINASALEHAAQTLRTRFRVEIQTYVVDLGDPNAIETLWSNLPVTPTILINNAGVFWTRRLPRIDNESFDRIFSINTKSVVLMCREMIGRNHRGGTIVNVSSIEAMKGMTYDMMLYGASKAAIPAISRALVKDFARKGWKINTILPGGINTPGTLNLGLTALKHFDFSVLETTIKFNLRLPARSMGNPDDIARMALWLGTPASNYMQGAEIVIDGGFLAV